MSKDEIYNYLLEKKIWHKILEHQAVYTMKDLKKVKYEIIVPEITDSSKELAQKYQITESNNGGFR